MCQVLNADFSVMIQVGYIIIRYTGVCLKMNPRNPRGFTDQNPNTPKKIGGRVITALRCVMGSPTSG